MDRWYTEIVEEDRIVQGRPLCLAERLNALSASGWNIRQVLPNGVNRWTVIAERNDLAQEQP